MICDRMREQIPEILAGKLEAAARARVMDHLETCSGCRSEMAGLGIVWRGLEAMQQPEPSDAVRTRFLETLNAYREGFDEAQRRQVYVGPRKSFWTGWWPAHPAWQTAFAVVLIAGGILGGRYTMSTGSTANSEMAELKGQVENLRQLVALSMLRDQSASSRLRGVTYSYQITRPDRQVEEALLHAVTHDSNVNVRLSAVDALGKFVANAEVRRGLADSLPMQDSPLVQVAVIDVLGQTRDLTVASAIEKVAKDSAIDPEVRKRAESTLERMRGVQ